MEKLETVHPEESWEGQEDSIWPVFSKKLGSENFIVRFPGDPSYRYLSRDEIEITATHQGETLELRVFEKKDPEPIEKRIQELSTQPNTEVIQVEQPDSHTLDLQYFSQGKWVSERVVVSSEHVYLFKTSAKRALTGNHRGFISSLDIERS